MDGKEKKIPLNDGSGKSRTVAVPVSTGCYNDHPAPYQHEQSTAPVWMVKLASEIDPLMNRHHDHIAAMVERWAEQQRERGPLGTHGPFQFRSDRPITLEDAYAITAAVHQYAMPERGGAWSNDSPAFEHECDEDKAPKETSATADNPNGRTFQTFVSHLRFLRESDQPMIGDYFAQVRINLQQENDSEACPWNRNVITFALTLKKIAEKVGVSEQTLRTARDKAGVKKPGRGQHGYEYSPHEVSQIARMRRNFCTTEKGEKPSFRDEKKQWECLLREIGQPAFDSKLKASAR